MGYRNLPIILSIFEPGQKTDRYHLELSVVAMEEDYRHSAPILKEILAEFLQGKYIQTDGKYFFYFGKAQAWIKRYGIEEAVYKVDTDEFSKEVFLGNWCSHFNTLVYDVDSLDEIGSAEPLCENFYASEDDDWGIIAEDKCFFSCITHEKKEIDKLTKIIERVVFEYDRKLLRGFLPYKRPFFTDSGPGDFFSHTVAWEIGYYGNKDIENRDEYEPFLEKPLYLFSRDENNIALALPSDYQYSGCNRYFDGVVLRALSKEFDLSFELDKETEVVEEFAGVTDRSYRDGNKLVIRVFDDCMYCDYFRIRNVETLWYDKGEFCEKKENPLFHLTFSPIGLNSNLYANFEIFDSSCVERIRAALADCCKNLNREIFFDRKVEIKTFDEYVICNPYTNENLIPKEEKKKKTFRRLLIDILSKGEEQ